MVGEDDLRAELTALGGAAAAREDIVVERVLAEARRRGPRRSVWLTAAAVAVVLLIPAGIGGLIALAPGRDAVVAGAPAPAVTARAPFAVTFTQTSIGGLDVTQIDASAQEQVAVLVPPERDWSIRLALADPGAPEPVLARPGTRVVVGGRPGIYVPGAQPPDPASAYGAVLQWEYRDDAWAVLQADRDDKADDDTLRSRFLAVAADLRVGPPMPLRLPFRVAQLPAGLVPIKVGVDDRLAGPDLWGGQLTCLDPGTGGQFEIRLSEGSAFGPDQKPGINGVRPDRTVAGHPAHAGGGELIVDFGDFSVIVFPNGPEPAYSEAELERVVTAMTFADWKDPASWYDASTVLAR